MPVEFFKEARESPVWLVEQIGTSGQNILKRVGVNYPGISSKEV
jgi:hypothetical protein